MAKKSVSIPQVGWEQAVPAPVVLITGSEQLLSDRAWSLIRKRVRDSTPDVEIHEIDAQEYASGELFTLASPSLFGEPRLIRVQSVEKSTDSFIADARAYLEQPDDTTTLVLMHAGGVRGKALLDAVRSGSGSGIEVLCAEIKPAERRRFLQAEIKRHGVQVEPRAVDMLLDAYQNDLSELVAVLSQLVESGTQRISEQEIERLTGGRVEAHAFRVAEATIAGRTSEALLLMRQSLETGTAAIPLLAAINMKLRAMARVFGARGSTGVLAREFGMAPWQLERAMKDLRGWNETDLARMIDLGAQTDFALKGGAKHPEFALEKFILLVAQRGRSPQSQRTPS